MNKNTLTKVSLTALTLLGTASCGRNIGAPVNMPSFYPTNEITKYPGYNSLNQPVTGLEPVPGNNTLELKILTFNTWGVLKYVTKELEKRVELITTEIDGFDLVNLQETTVKETKAITDKNTYYPYRIRYDNTSFLKWGSGLSTLSKYEILEKKFMKFSSCAALDCNNNKGVLFMRLDVPGFGKIDLYNTHYQSMPWMTKYRLQANKDFEKFYKENTEGNLEIITGDFNLTDKDEDYKDFMKRFNAVDTFKEKYPDVPGFTYDKTKNKNAFKLAEPQRIDFIFFIPNKKYNVEILDSKIMFTEPKEGLFLSDHFGLASTLKITKTPALTNGF